MSLHRLIPALLALLILLMAGSHLTAQDTAKPLIIGMELNYPPFEMTDPDGNPTGVGVDMARALGDYLHRPIQIQNTPFEGRSTASPTSTSPASTSS
jgi:polar amino acid transport system substrate-binding protein